MQGKPPVATIFNRAEHFIETAIFASRWLMAPFYLLMIAALGVLLVKFTQELLHIVAHGWGMTKSEAILGVRSLIDISLAGNLLLMVLFSGYENFVSKLQVEDHEDKPSWMGKVDFSSQKLKLIASIVAISGINLLKHFMALGTQPVTPMMEREMTWMVIIHVCFILSGVMLAFMDRIVIASHVAEHKA